jgi:phospholipid/cholesterol/gamma-HCH transport system ATP-binding protein
MTGQTNGSLVQVRGLHFQRDGRPILNGVDLDVVRGRITAILGPSACGKSTLLRNITGEWRPSAGTVEFDGINVHQLHRRDLFKLRRRIGMQFQSGTGALLTDLTVFENVAFPLREHTDLPESMIRDVVLMKLELVGLRGARDLYAAQLSGGMARRVALARAIVFDPDLVIYDEPFAGQDPINVGSLMRVLQTFNRGLGLTAIVVSHSVEETLAISDYAYVMVEGRLIEHGTPEDIVHSKSEHVQQFLKGNADGPVAFHYPTNPGASTWPGF